jgi:alpha-acetolactate decarboxylase
VKKGDSVKKGQVIGISGNSGMKNCQPLGYHLHFETEKAFPHQHIQILLNMLMLTGI